MKLWMVSFVFVAASAEAQVTFVVHGAQKTCAAIIELDQNINLDNKAYFAGWSRDDFNDAARWAAACVQDGFRGWGPTRVARLRAFEQRVNGAAYAEQRRLAVEQKLRDDQAKQQQEQIEARAALAAQQLSIQASIDKHNAEYEALQRCRSIPAARLYEAQERIITDVGKRDRLQAALQKEKRIADVSGAENLTREYAIGSELVHVTDDLTDAQAKYVALGGDERQPELVTHRLVDPCLKRASRP